MQLFDIDSKAIMDVSREFLLQADELMRMGTELFMIRDNLNGMTNMGDVCSAIATEAKRARQNAINVEDYGYMARNIVGSYNSTEQRLACVAENLNVWEV